MSRTRLAVVVVCGVGLSLVVSLVAATAHESAPASRPAAQVTPTASAPSPSYAPAPVVPSPTRTATPPPGSWSLAFDDEFDGSALDTTKWDTRYPWGDQSNGANHEQQCYVPGALTEGGGQLTITATRQSTGCAVGGQQVVLPYASGMIQSSQSYSFTYGYAEIRARLPGGHSMWSAFWLLPTSRHWPPELDVLEGWGHGGQDTVLGKVVQSLLWPQSTGGAGLDRSSVTGKDFTSAWHTFGVRWEPGAVTFLVDGVEQARHTDHTPGVPMYLLANLAVAGTADATTPSTGHMYVDYVRVWKARG
jgi:beta-glucanase (GH16 family)